MSQDITASIPTPCENHTPPRGCCAIFTPCQRATEQAPARGRQPQTHTPIRAASRRHNSSLLAGDTAPLSIPMDGEVKSSSQPATEEGGTPAAPSRGLLCTTARWKQTGSLAKRSIAFPRCQSAGELLSRCQPLPLIRPPLLQELVLQASLEGDAAHGLIRAS